MSSLLHKLGLSPKLAFHNVYSIDDPELLAFTPRPAQALLLVFPASNTYEEFRLQEDANKPEYEGSGPEEPVVWYKQMIGKRVRLNWAATRCLERGSTIIHRYCNAHARYGAIIHEGRRTLTATQTPAQASQNYPATQYPLNPRLTQICFTARKPSKARTNLRPLTVIRLPCPQTTGWTCITSAL